MIAYVDGSPVLAKVAVYIQGVCSVYSISSPVTNNEAEYLAVFCAMAFHKNITQIQSDSQLVVNQLNGLWKINKPELRVHYDQIKHLERIHYIGGMSYIWIPRTLNKAGQHLEWLLKAYKVGL